jgi:Fe-S-cluster containining protein
MTHDHDPPAAAPDAPRRLTLSEARDNPCMTCQGTPCCSHVPLHTFAIQSLNELDHALYLLNFQRIELGLSANGEWSVYYRYPCRFLDRATHRCTVWRTEWQPSICVHYNPYACWYQRALIPTVSDGFLRIDRRRMDYIVDRLVFDENRVIVETPDWAAMTRDLAELPIDPAFDEAFEPDPVFDQWLAQSALGEVSAPRDPRMSYRGLTQACEGCAAYCCKTLIFPQNVPVARSSLDYMQFVLGFPGLELGISDARWFIVVKTRCRHLQEDRCSLYGKPERPQICTFYDASACQYVSQFGRERPRGFLRVRLEQFPWLVETMGFAEDGTIEHLPATEELRRYIERRWQEAVAVAEEDALVASAPEAAGTAEAGPARAPAVIAGAPLPAAGDID